MFEQRRKENTFHGETKEKRGFKITLLQVSTKGISLWTTDWGIGSTVCLSSFLQTPSGAQTQRFLVVCDFFQSRVVGMLLGRRELALECVAWYNEFWGALGGNSLGVILQEGLLPFQGQNTLQYQPKAIQQQDGKALLQSRGAELHHAVSSKLQV